MDSPSKIKKAISQGRTKLALNVLKELCQRTRDSFYIDQCHMLESRYSQLKNDEIYGIGTQKSRNSLSQSINKAILDVSNQIEIDEFKQQLVESKAVEKVYDGKVGGELLDSDNVKIAMAGQPNVGKTTLMRNIFKSEIGKIDDASNVTISSYLKEQGELGVAFIDCPGFNEPGRVLDWLSMSESEEAFNSKLVSLDLEEDLSAYKGIKSADVIYYVVSVMSVPDKGDRSLLQLIKRVNTNVIGIINMGFHVGRTDPKKSSNRIEKWEMFFFENDVKSIIEYDFAWDRPTKIHELYNETLKYVEKNKRLLLEKSLGQMLKNYRSSSVQIADSIYDLIYESKNINYALILEDETDHKNKESKVAAVQEKIQKEVTYLLQNVLHQIKNLYQNEAKINDVDTEYSEQETTLKSSFSKKIDQIGEGMGVGAAIGAYGAFKALLAGAAVGGPAGIAVVAVIGGIYGLFSKRRASTTKVIIKLDSSDLLKLLEKTILLLWVASNKGYGIGGALSEDDLYILIEEKCRRLISDTGINKENIESPSTKEKLQELVLKVTLPEK